MGNETSSYHRCYNEYNSRFIKGETNYGLPLHKCNSTLNASFLREYPEGCYMYVCEDCYYKHYQTDEPPPLQYTTPDDIKLSKNEDGEMQSRTPKPEHNRSDEKKVENVYSPKWTEYTSGVLMI